MQSKPLLRVFLMTDLNVQVKQMLLCRSILVVCLALSLPIHSHSIPNLAVILYFVLSLYHEISGKEDYH